MELLVPPEALCLALAHLSPFSDQVCSPSLCPGGRRGSSRFLGSPPKPANGNPRGSGKLCGYLAHPEPPHQPYPPSLALPHQPYPPSHHHLIHSRALAALWADICQWPPNPLSHSFFSHWSLQALNSHHVGSQCTEWGDKVVTA